MLHESPIHKNSDFWIEFLFSNTKIILVFFGNTNNEPQDI